MKKALTPGETKILTAIFEHIAEHAQAPTVSELILTQGISKTRIDIYIAALRWKGHLLPAGPAFPTALCETLKTAARHHLESNPCQP